MNGACTKNAFLALACVINYDRKHDATIWSNHLTTLESSFTIVIGLQYRPQINMFCVWIEVLVS
jgi:hypothetical protein